jgi:uncharacterized membrane protein YgdD (TMEM256/DUF423 family)
MAWCSVLAGASVVLGAFGSHMLSGLLSAQKMDVYNKASYYLMTHSIAVILLLQVKITRFLRIYTWGIYSLLSGALVFSTSLYLVAFSELPDLSGLRYFGAVAPLGGTLMIAGWFMCAIFFFKIRKA